MMKSQYIKDWLVWWSGITFGMLFATACVWGFYAIIDEPQMFHPEVVFPTTLLFQVIFNWGKRPKRTDYHWNAPKASFDIPTSPKHLKNINSDKKSHVDDAYTAQRMSDKQIIEELKKGLL
jgi:hypothetical protein